MGTVQFHLNGEAVTVTDATPNTTLLDWLRRDARLTGTKEGCAEGDCGACTVAVLDAEAPEGPTWRAINSCLVLLPLVHGQRVVTVEGLAPRTGALHPAQQAMVDTLGSQCGYCTPGVVMSLFEATYRQDLRSPWQLDDQLSGNLCRCTGYRPIRDAATQVAGTRPADGFSAAMAAPAAEQPALRWVTEAGEAHIPTDFDALFDVLDRRPDARLICGATDLGLDVTKQGKRFECLVSLQGLPLRGVTLAPGGGWRIGATTRLSDLELATEHALPPVARMLRFFGSRQIKNRATVGGNLCNASPIGDLAPVLLSLGAVAVIRGRAGERRLPLADFFVAYRKTALAAGEILAAVEVPPLGADAKASAYKVSKRREMDISAVACGLWVAVDAQQTITAARFGFGGMAATPARAPAAEAAVVGQPFSAATFAAAADALRSDFTPLSDHRGSAWYRMTVATNLLKGFFHEVRETAVPLLAARPSGTLLTPDDPADLPTEGAR